MCYKGGGFSLPGPGEVVPAEDKWYQGAGRTRARKSFLGNLPKR